MRQALLAFDFLQRSLPMALMAFLALFTYLLSRQAPQISNATPQIQSAAQSHQLLDFSTRQFGKDGLIGAQFFGRQSLQNPATGAVHVDDFSAFYRQSARHLEATAKVAEVAANRDDYLLSGNVTLVRRSRNGTENTLNLRGDALRYKKSTETVVLKGSTRTRIEKPN